VIKEITGKFDRKNYFFRLRIVDDGINNRSAIIIYIDIRSNIFAAGWCLIHYDIGQTARKMKVFIRLLKGRK